MAEAASLAALCRGVLVQVQKHAPTSLSIMPPLTIDPVDLEAGLDILERAVIKTWLELVDLRDPSLATSHQIRA